MMIFLRRWKWTTLAVALVVALPFIFGAAVVAATVVGSWLGLNISRADYWRSVLLGLLPTLAFAILLGSTIVRVLRGRRHA